MPRVVFRLRRNTSVQWTALNPILEPGEPGYETNTRRIKIGDGSTPWNELDYVFSDTPPPDGGTSDAALLSHINSLTPHPVYDDGPSLTLLYQNAKV